MQSKINYKPAFLTLIAVILNAIVIIVTSLLFKSFKSEERRAERFLSDKGISTDELGGMMFEMESVYKFKDGEKREIKGNEVYYWNGRRFISASEFLKGYDDWWKNPLKWMWFLLLLY